MVCPYKSVGLNVWDSQCLTLGFRLKVAGRKSVDERVPYQAFLGWLGVPERGARTKLSFHSLVVVHISMHGSIDVNSSSLCDQAFQAMHIALMWVLQSGVSPEARAKR